MLKEPLKSYESALVALDSREQSIIILSYNVGLMNAFDLSQSQTLLATAQSVLRTKYDYIFKKY
jgi:outer membrane protein